MTGGLGVGQLIQHLRNFLMAAVGRNLQAENLSSV